MNEIMSCIYTFCYIPQMSAGSSLFDFFSTPYAIGMYLAILMFLVAVISGAVLIALHMMRKDAENIRSNSPYGEAGAVGAEKTVADTSASRFSQLARIDEELSKSTADVPYDTCELDELCEKFREYAAGKLGLYYDISDIRRFIAGMGISKLIILRGMSGTGKTSLAYAAGEFFGNSSTVVPIQPMWKERSDMIGYFNEFTKKFNETTMLCKLYEAGGKGDVYITVLDEVNISRIEYYFAEFLSLLELPDTSKRYLDVVSDTWKNDPARLVNGKLLLPVNMWFVGTANNDDSTFAISDKVYDRAAVIDLDRKCTPFVCDTPSPCHISYEALAQLFEKAKGKYTLSSESKEKLKRLDEYLSEVFRVSFGNRIMRQIEAYVPVMLACGGTETEALDDILARKILRKLEQLSPAFVKSESDNLLSLLDELFGEEAMLQSRQYIEKMQKGY
ncbi:MAG: hypothetical protein IIW63_06360 [Clostridia bacterium]|nr:hypothetical protein [Clostridia bacterium]